MKRTMIRNSSSAKLAGAREAALQFLRKEHINITEENLVNLMLSQNVIVQEAPLQKPASTISQDGCFAVVTVNANIRNEGRRRFCIAHEFGHYTLKHVDTAKSCLAEDFETWYENNWQEQEANAFASEFLMPTPLFKSFTRGKPPTMKAIEFIMNKFRVSATAACIRYAQNGPNPCIVFASTDGVVRWYWPSDDMRRTSHLIPGQKVIEWSSAGEYFLNGEKEDKDELVDYDAWFTDHPKEMPRIHETPIYRDSMNTVISLVWLD